MSCSKRLKSIIIFFNGIIFLAGAGILAVGIWVKVDSGPMMGLVEKIPNAPSELGQMLNVGYVLIAFGVLLTVCGFLGCCGAILGNKCMLMLFFIIVTLLFLVGVAGAIMLFVFRPLVDNLLVKFGIVAVQTIKTDYGTNPDITGLWNSIMIMLKCCGFNNYTDFTNSSYHQDNGYPLPCCLDSEPACGKEALSTAVPNLPGCFTRVKEMVKANSGVIIGVAVGIGVLELGAMITSMSLFCRLKRG